MKLGKKIVVLGVSASGKSTFARSLVNKIDLPLTHMDSVMWKPGWNYIGDEETVRRLDEISAGPEWVIEGYISKGARAFVLNRADTILYLDYPSYIPAWRYVRRWFRHRTQPRPELEGSPEEFSFAFLRRIWNKAEVYRLVPLLEEDAIKSKVHTFRSVKETDRFLAELG